MEQLLKDIQSLRRIFSNRDFWFVLITYPVGFFLYMCVINKMKDAPLLIEETQEFCSVVCMLVACFFVGYTVFEIIDKKLLYKNQGDKLKLKRYEKEWQKTIK